MEESIYIYFTSDLHSYFDNWPKIMYSINKKIENHKRNGHDFLLLDNGDHIDRSEPITDASFGLSNVQLLNDANYHAVTIGNNEGITLPPDQLYHLYDQANFQIVCANVEPVESMLPKWLKPYYIFETNQQTKIGVIGLTAPFQAFYEKLGWTTKNPIEVLNDYLPELRKRCDVIVVLSHLGVYEEEAIAKKFPVDVIIGGHTHHLYEQGKRMNDSLMTAVGKHGFYYGEIILKLDSQTKQIISKEGYALQVKNKKHKETDQLLQTLKQESDKKLAKVITTLDEPLEIDWFDETPIMKKFVETLKNWTKADCAMLNAGVLLKGFPKGDVTKAQILESCPHPMNPCTMVLTGKELIEMVRMVEKEEFIHIKLKGFGFRGEKIGKMIYSNIDLDFHGNTDYVETVYVNKRPMNPKEHYVVATADTFSFPQLIPAISSVNEKTYFLPELIRDLLEECLTNVYK